MKRKEVYATTGSRITVRFFGGFDFTQDDALGRQPAIVGYEKGVPMGGDLSKAPKDKAPTFLVAALKDAYSGNLDRIQIIKGWVDKAGKTHEKVYDVVWSDPDFDSTLRAFYYVRVLEIPTPRWTTYDAVKFGLKIGKEVPVSIQERAFTSPIWYTLSAH